MRRLLLGASGALLAGTAAFAQAGSSLEEDYATLCAGKPEPASETCVALKKALIAKLGGNDSGTAMTSPQGGVGQASAPTLRSQGNPHPGQPFSPAAGVLQQLVGTWTNGTFVWEVEEIGPENIETTFFKSNGKAAASYNVKHLKKGWQAAGPISTFGLYFYWSKDALIFLSPDQFQLTNAKLVDGALQQREDDPRWNGVYHRLSPTEMASWRGTREQRQASSGGGGLGSILAGAAMGSILGGGGQNSVDLAVAGAQAAAQGGNTLDVLNSMGDVAAANAAESARELNETIARAQGGSSNGASMASTASSTSSSGYGSASSRPAMTRKTIEAYFTAGTVMRDDDDHNTRCQSNIFSVTIDWVEGASDNLGRANAVLDPMKSRFAERCSAAGRPVTALANVDWFADAFDSSGGGWGSGRQLRKGDIEVQMP